MQEFLASFAVDIDEAGVSRLQKILRDNRDPAGQKEKEAIRTLGLKEREFGKKPAKLSGGQCQRVAIARAMINDPKVVFADEPTASLDHENAFNVMKILKKYSEDRLVLVVTHDRSVLTDVDMMVEMWDGTISNITTGRA